MNKVMLEIKDLKKSFNVSGQQTIDVLKGVNLTVYDGEFVSLMGESGSGKSTLLYQIGSLDKPTSGEILIEGENIQKANDERQSLYRRDNIGFVFQFYNLVQNLTVKENIMLPVIMDGKKEKDYEERLEKILKIVGLSRKKNSLPYQLSGGEQQRVSIARAIILSPSIILADEPIGNLDSKSGAEVMNLFKTINKEENITILQATHSEEASKYGNRTIRLKDGKINDK